MNDPVAHGSERDRGAVLPLVLVLIVVAGLIIVPTLAYTATVFRANHVLSDRTKQLEAAKGALRVALGDPGAVFVSCDGSGPLATVEINGITVTNSCTELEEVGPFEALGYEVPIGATAIQLGATVPASLSGTVAQSDPVPPYPVAPDWWAGQASARPADGMIWMPDLPEWPATARSATPFEMPAGFDCKVFFPGRYSDPIDISAGRVYFASGVYYFDDTVTIRGSADVVVGYGLEEFGTGDCADDIQVAANVVNGPSTFGIDGGGATFVFGGDGHLVVDDTAGGSPSIRFNQRYATEDRGGRISILTVNGDATTSAEHWVDDVNRVPRSAVVDAASDPPTQRPIVPGTYQPSSVVYTDAARVPLPVSGLTVQWLRAAPPITPPGVARVSWDAVTGQAAGGALLDGEAPYDVRVTRNAQTYRCDAGSLAVSRGTGTAGADQVSCLVTGIPPGAQHTVHVSAVNAVGTGPEATATGTVHTTGGTPATELQPVAPPTAVLVAAGDDPDEARVSWTPPVDTPSSAPVVGYDVAALRVDVAGEPASLVETEVGTCSTAADPFQPVATTCEIAGLAPLTSRSDGTTSGPLGYRFEVVSRTTLGTSTPASSVTEGALPAGAPFPLDVLSIGFDGSGEPPPVRPERYVVPWTPEPVIDIRAGGAGATTVAIAGYVAVPMGRLRVTNPNGDDVRMVGGVMAGTFDITDARGASGTPGSVPIGFHNEIVLQRRVRVTSQAGNVTSTAVVQLNEDGASYAVNSWVIS